MASTDYKELLEDLRKKQSKLIHDLNQTLESEASRVKISAETEIRLKGLQDYYGMRKTWGNFLKLCLSVILVFNILLVIFVGFGLIKYNDEWFLRLVLTTNLADIIGLVYLVVHFLFSNQNEINTKQG